MHKTLETILRLIAGFGVFFIYWYTKQTRSNPDGLKVIGLNLFVICFILLVCYKYRKTSPEGEEPVVISNKVIVFGLAVSGLAIIVLGLYLILWSGTL